ncbi:Outer membrane protein OmpA [Prosthecobacter debontii]|uniref:Outer membrane protein OmpA n=1 Tax=Prosthecobacter debontii TaxID=48467 RepID=A0A1T4WG40_9BACT|nr:OmpA family protein [Prosthecobacter debontii]SKA75938.1 Outer membrane protein OmpA [Prosthecobacter debontii]
MANVSQSPVWSSTPRSSFRSREDWSLKWWIMFALILSFLLHGLLYVSFDKISVFLGHSIPQQQVAAKVPERIKIDPKLLQEQKAIQEIPEMIAPGNQPDIKSFEPNLDNFDKAAMIPENQEIDLTPNVKEVTNFIRNGDLGDGKTPGGKMPDMAALLAPQAIATPDLATEMASMRRDVLSKPVSEKQMLIDAGGLDPADGGEVDMKLLDQVKAQGDGDGVGSRVKGYSNLDDLLGGGGAMGGSTAPILMPTDLLFEYGSDQLAEGARLSLMKLGFLIQKNPDSLFIIEGHTDSFGGDDFNLQLSMRRANAVVEWLRNSLRLGTDRVQAMGMGKSKPIVTTTGTVEEQSLNRRVEIKVRPRK